MTTAPTADAVVRDGRLLRLRVARGRHGTLDDDALPLIAQALNTADPDEIGAALMVSEGTSFCTGGDVRAFASAADRGAYVAALAEAFHEMVTAIATCPVPVVAAVPGWAAGAGMSIVCAVDIAVAGSSTRLRPAYPGIGFSPDGGMSWTLPRLVGSGNARRILLTDEVLDAEAAATLGIVGMVVDDDAVLAAAERLAVRLADGPTVAFGRIKALLAASLDCTLSEQLVAEERAIAASAAGPEGAEGLAAFVEKRPPKFR